MKKLEFTIDINAPAEKVWYSLWDEENYKNWTNAFCEGSYVVTDYKEGSKAHFLSPSGEGMFSSVSINKPFEIMSFNHIGILKNFEEQPIDDETKLWSGCEERYELVENNGKTTVKASVDVIDQHVDYFDQSFPNGLKKLKEISENPSVKSISIYISVNAPIEKVWDYWTNPKHIVNWNNASDDWHTPSAKNDLKVGGTFICTMAAKDGSMSFDFEGKYSEIDTYKKIVYQIADGRNVSITFNLIDDKVIITETFEPETENSLELQRGGWQAILTNFKKYTENN